MRANQNFGTTKMLKIEKQTSFRDKKEVSMLKIIVFEESMIYKQGFSIRNVFFKLLIFHPKNEDFSLIKVF